MIIMLTAPKTIVFFITLIAAVVACVGEFKKVPGLNALSFPILLGAYILLAAGVLFKGI